MKVTKITKAFLMKELWVFLMERSLWKKEVQKTNAYQQNNNVLVSDRSTINAKPQLEIFADDVKCSHGCTIGQLDEQALFYMQQRGILKKKPEPC